MTKDPLISVIMATYNQAEFLPDALASLCHQTLGVDNFEVVVINDGSTDGTNRVLAEHGAPIRAIRQEHSGLVASCNLGLAEARGTYFARMDSDDLVAPEWLSALHQRFEENPAACCVAPDRVEFLGTTSMYVAVDETDLYTLTACGSMFRTDALRSVGGFRPLYWEEYDLYLRLRAVGPIVRVAAPLYRYRRHPASMTHDADARRRGWLELAGLWDPQALLGAGRNEELERIIASGEGERKPDVAG